MRHTMPTLRAPIALVLAMAACTWALAAQAPAPTMASPLRDFWIYGWRAPTIDGTDARLKAMADAGFTVVNASEDELAAVARHGVKAMLVTKDPAVARRLASNPAVWGYHLGDEPFPEAVFAGIGQQMRAFEAAAPRQVPFVNMLSTTGGFLRAYMTDARPRLLSFDYYQWWWGSDRYFEKLEQFREAAVKAGVPLAACFEASANPGVEWFQTGMVFVEKTGALTPLGRDVATINHEIAPLGRVLAGLESVDVFHTAPLPAGTRSLPKEHWVQAIPEERAAGVVLGMFRDTEGRDYAMLANRDYRDAQTVVVKLQSKWLGVAPWYTPKRYKYAVDRFDRTAGTWTTVASSSSVGFSYVVRAAEAELFRVTTTVEQDGSAEAWPVPPRKP